VHHVAFRTPDDTQYDAWAERLNALRIPNSGKVEPLLFSQPLFPRAERHPVEIATTGPGFATDEPLETLGERLALRVPGPQRARHRSRLKPL